MRIAVLGLGFMGTTHVKALRSVNGVQLAAVFANDEKQLSGDLTEMRGNLGTKGEMMDFSAVKKYRELAPLLADPDVDGVDICLPTDMHASVAIDALRAGKHVLIEKPMALDGATADRILEEARRQNGRVLMTAQVLRFWPEYMALHDGIRSGQLGAVRTATFRRRCAKPDWGGWLFDPVKSGGGAFDLLIHDIDMCLHLFGAPEAISATGYLDLAGTDSVTAQLFYPNGLAVLVTGGWHPPSTMPFSMEFTVIFDKGTMDFSSSGRPLTLYAQTGGGTVLKSPGLDGYTAELQYFVDCCNSGKAPEICPPAESAAAVKLMLAVLEARNRNGEKIPCKL